MTENKTCLFCDKIAHFNETIRSTVEIKCDNCGFYVVSNTFADQDRDIIKKYIQHKHLISGLIREKNDLKLQIEIITNQNIENLMNDALIPKTLMQKLDKILLYYYRKSNTFGSWLKFDENTPYSIGYAKNSEELSNLIQGLIDYGLFKYINHGGHMKQFSVSLNGISRAEEILSTNTISKKVFVAMGFKNDLLEAHEKAIVPACKECGFDAFLIIETEHNGDITDKIISEIKTSKFVITDFTYNNQGAYFEAGYAQGRGLEVIRTCKNEWFNGVDEHGEKNRLHFDINHYNFILWDDVEDLKNKLVNRIKATIL